MYCVNYFVVFIILVVYEILYIVKRSAIFVYLSLTHTHAHAHSRMRNLKDKKKKEKECGVWLNE